MVHKELPQAWWFSHNHAKPSPWLNNTLSELDDKTKQMLDLIEQDADSFAQRAEMYYKKRPILVDMLGDLYRTHRSLAEQYDLLKHGSGTRHRVFGLSSCMQIRPQAPMNGKATPGSSCSVSTYDSESEVDDPEQEELEEEEVSQSKTESSQEEQKQQQEYEELMRAEIERLKEQNAALQKVAEENAALKAKLAEKDEEKREVIRQLASSFDMMRVENCTLRDRIRESKNSSSCQTMTLRDRIRESKNSSSRKFDLKKVAKDLFSARLFTAHCRPTGPIVAL